MSYFFLLGPTSSCDELPPSDSEDETKPNPDQPHLRFEIVSDDGFSVEADSIEGEHLPSILHVIVSLIHSIFDRVRIVRQ